MAHLLARRLAICIEILGKRLDLFFEARPCFGLSVELGNDLVLQRVVREHAGKDGSNDDGCKGQPTDVANEIEGGVHGFLDEPDVGVQVEADGEPVATSRGPTHDLGPLHFKELLVGLLTHEQAPCLLEF